MSDPVSSSTSSASTTPISSARQPGVRHRNSRHQDVRRLDPDDPPTASQVSLVEELLRGLKRTNLIAERLRQPGATITDHMVVETDDHAQRMFLVEPEARRVAELRELLDQLPHINLVTITGYDLRGVGPRDGYKRLFLTPVCDAYIDVSEQYVVACIPLQPASPLAGMVLWLRGEAEVQYTRVSKQQEQAQFLTGTVLQNYLRQTDGQPQLRTNTEANSRKSANLLNFFEHTASVC
jgi:hypothetical protein